MGWAAGAWAPGAWAGTAWATQNPPVEVPDVVGQTQAAGTSTLEGDGFVVVVQEAYSDSVEEGNIISQVPAGGSFAANGATVTIVVSLGPAPVPPSLPGGDGTSRGRKKKRKRVITINGMRFVGTDDEIAAFAKSPVSPVVVEPEAIPAFVASVAAAQEASELDERIEQTKAELKAVGLKWEERYAEIVREEKETEDAAVQFLMRIIL